MWFPLLQFFFFSLEPHFICSPYSQFSLLSVPLAPKNYKGRIAKTSQTCLDCTFHLFRLYVITALYIKSPDSVYCLNLIAILPSPSAPPTTPPNPTYTRPLPQPWQSLNMTVRKIANYVSNNSRFLKNPVSLQHQAVFYYKYGPCSNN